MKNSIKLSIIAFCFAATLSLFNCSNNNKQISQWDENHPNGNVSISGAFAMYPLTIKWAEEYNKLYPDVKFNISAGGAGKGMTDALSDMVDIGMFSRNITQDEINKGAWFIAVARDAVFPTISTKNPVIDSIKAHGMKRENFQDIFINQKIKSWNQFGIFKNEITMNIYTRSDACGAAQMWASYLGYDQENLQGIGIFGDPGIADAVKKDPYGIGYNNLIYVYDIQTGLKYEGLEIIPLDLNGDGNISDKEDFYDNINVLKSAINNGIYPAPPARDLFFVAHGKPTNPACVHFLNWVLGHGQKYIDIAGYIALPEESIIKMKHQLN